MGWNSDSFRLSEIHHWIPDMGWNSDSFRTCMLLQRVSVCAVSAMGASLRGMPTCDCTASVLYSCQVGCRGKQTLNIPVSKYFVLRPLLQGLGEHDVTLYAYMKAERRYTVLVCCGRQCVACVG